MNRARLSLIPMAMRLYTYKVRPCIKHVDGIHFSELTSQMKTRVVEITNRSSNPMNKYNDEIQMADSERIFFLSGSNRFFPFSIDQHDFGPTLRHSTDEYKNDNRKLKP